VVGVSRADLLAGLGLILLDSQYANEPTPEDHFAAAPRLLRDDFVFNANDSYWLSNPSAPLRDFSPLFGPVDQPLLPRTRMNLKLLSDTSPTGAMGTDAHFSLSELVSVVMDDRGLMGLLLRDELAARCTSSMGGPVELEGESVSVTLQPACEVLARWDGRTAPDSAGALLFREFLGTFDVPSLLDRGELFEVAFDPAHPQDTPRSLRAARPGERDPVLTHLATAVRALERAGLALDATPQAAQFTVRGERIAVHGCLNREGCLNALGYTNQDNTSALPRMPRGKLVDEVTGLESGGYTINFGSSFVLALEFQQDGPHAQAILTYSQSEVPGSPHYSDQTRLWSTRALRPVAFTEAEIAADPALVSRTLSVP